MYSDVTGIILAGGKSNRMGTNKSLLILNGQTVIERVVDLLISVFNKVIIITNTPEEYEFIKLPIYKDIYIDKGPLAGIHSGLTNSETDQNFIISCDMPLMTKEMINYIVDYNTGKPITVCEAGGFIQQLAGKYSKSILPFAENLLNKNDEKYRNLNRFKKKYKVLSLMDKTGAEIIDAKKIDFYDEFLFYNMNKPEDYEKLKKIVP